MNESKGRYFVKDTSNGTFQDVTTLFDGVAVLKMDGFLARGKAVNVFTQQWLDSQEEDFMITTLDDNKVPVVVRENTDIELTFIVRQKYASGTIDVLQVHDTFVEYMTEGAVWLKSSYFGNKSVKCVCRDEYKPTIAKLGRGENDYIMGTLKLHTLEKPE